MNQRYRTFGCQEDAIEFLSLFGPTTAEQPHRAISDSDSTGGVVVDCFAAQLIGARIVEDVQ